VNKEEQLELLIEKSKEVGKLSEQMRIIELLNKVALGQQSVLDFNNNRKDKHDRELVVATVYQLIALIREEQK
jgi:hypothetical protein